jgi:hypothetical protein
VREALFNQPILPFRQCGALAFDVEGD